MADKKYKRKFSADEMSVILQSVENTAFLGKFSESVTRIKKKFRIARSIDDGEPALQPVADLVKRLPPRGGSSAQEAK